MTVVAVGKSSFIAQELAKNPLTKAWLFLSHEAALTRPEWLVRVTAIVNFSFPPQFKTQAYDPQQDIDSTLAEMVRAKPVHYFMLSSRMVYGQGGENFDLTEDREPQPSNPYGRSKLAVERSLQSILGPGRVTILRLSNVFGMERGRGSFFGRMLESLASEGRIVFDMSADTQRDFFPVQRLTRVLPQIVALPAGGIFNLGAGFAAKCGDIASWLIEGYGEGALEVTDPALRDQFSLNMSKAQETWKLPVFHRGMLREEVAACGKALGTMVQCHQRAKET